MSYGDEGKKVYASWGEAAARRRCPSVAAKGLAWRCVSSL